MRKITFICICLLAGVWAYLNRDTLFEPSYLHELNVGKDKKYVFPGLDGPRTVSLIEDPVAASWKSYKTDNVSALAILLTDTTSDWLGLVHGLKNIGIPFTVTDNVQEAVQHHTVMVYPLISGKVLNVNDLRTLAAIPRKGGNLIGINVYGGLNEVFGFDSVIANKGRSQLMMTGDIPGITDGFTHDHERNVRLTSRADFPDELPTNGYTNARNPVILFKEDNTTFLAYKDYGAGKALAFGLDLGNYFLRYMNERGFNAYRSYANNFDGGLDVMLRILKNVYSSSPVAVTIGTVPYNKSISMVITHDVDYSKSIINAVKYAEMEKELGVRATYFIQTKYIKDWNDDIFFRNTTIKYLQQLHEAGMEVGSHSVSHSRVFSKFELGTGKERYPRYSPFVKDKKTTYNGSILGELRVSKFLLEHTIGKPDVVSFRPGHLQNPFALPQALKATGYQFSSCATANNVQTHLPFMRMYDRGFVAECDIVEMPITIEDELGAPMLQRLDSAIAVADELSKYGGLMNVLIHTDTLGQKFAFERALILSLKDKAWITTIRELGKWWKIRNELEVKVRDKGDRGELTILNASGEILQGLTLHLPEKWQIIPEDNGAIQRERALIIPTLGQEMKFAFKKVASSW